MKQLSVELNDRTLRFDGVSVVDPDHLVEALLRGVHPSALRVTEHTPSTEVFNDTAENGERIRSVSEGPEPINLSFTWQLPEPHLSMDLEATVVARAVDRLKELDYEEDLHLQACERVQAELDEIKRRGMVEFFKTVIYVIDVFRQKGIIWGVGRGSSCASYVLYLLGLHSVDCVVYNVDMREFFHD